MSNNRGCEREGTARICASSVRTRITVKTALSPFFGTHDEWDFAVEGFQKFTTFSQNLRLVGPCCRLELGGRKGGGELNQCEYVT